MAALEKLKQLRKLNLELTKEHIVKSTGRDIVIIQTVHSVNELIKVIDRMTKNLRERYGWYAPTAAKIENPEKFLQVVLNKKREEMGIELSTHDLEAITELVKEIQNLIKLKEKQIKYLENLMAVICPELLRVAGVLIGARLIDLAGSMKRLAELPSSTIQVLGAEKALFKYLRKKGKGKPPKFGVIFSHPSVANAKEKEKGKAARQLASAISIAIKKDFFKKS